MKEYDLMWISPDPGDNNIFRERISTSNPKNALFNYACKMITMANSFFNSLSIDNIHKNIQTGATDKIKCERYWIEFDNGEILSCMEVIDKR